MTLLSSLGAILMVGHSLIGPDQPAMLQQLLGGEARVEAQIINGAPLQWNWDNSADAQGVDGRARLSGGVDALILTEAIPLANHVQWSDSATNVLRWADLARSANPDVQVFVLETWHSLDSGTGVDVPHDEGDTVPWRQRLRDDLPVWQALADGAGARLIPAGQAMGRLADAIADGTVPGLDDVSDIFSGDIHPTDLGHYFIALVAYATLTGGDPVGLPHALRGRYDSALVLADTALIERLQTIAGEVAGDAARVPESAPVQPAAPPEIVVVPAAVETTAPEPVKLTAGMAVNLAPIADWGVQLPFLDLMKTARPWIGHRPGQWGGIEADELRDGGFLDAAGWPLSKPDTLSSIGTLILTDLPENAAGAAGRYRLQFDGKGIVEVAGRATAVRYGTGTVTFDFTPGPGAVDIRIQRTDPTDPVRAITVVREDRAADFDAGGLFNPDWLALMRGFRVLRFMDWMATNNSTQSTWDNRPRPEDYTFARRGVPVEYMLALIETLGVDPWFTLPHLADDGYVTGFAETVAAALPAERQAWVEFSNEVWNWQFAQTRWADEQAQARWAARDAGGQFYGMRAAEVAAIWSAILPKAQLVNVISSQTGWLGLEDIILNAPLAVAEGRAPPHTAFDAYAVTGYFGGILGTEGNADTVRGWLAESRAADPANPFDLASRRAAAAMLDGSTLGDPADSLADLLGRVLPHHKAVADRHNLRLVMYEGGSHLTGIGPMAEDGALTEFFIHFNYTPEMGGLYTRLLNGWQALGGEMFNVFNDVYHPSRWGSWGARRHLGDDNPRWRALVAAQ